MISGPVPYGIGPFMKREVRDEFTDEYETPHAADPGMLREMFDTAEAVETCRLNPTPKWRCSMILMTRATARDFRAAFLRCLTSRPRDPAPPVVVRFAGGTRTIACTTGDGAILTHDTATDERDDLLVLPADFLGKVEGGTDEGVRLDRLPKWRGVLHWHVGTKPRTLPVELLPPSSHHDLPQPPDFTPVSAKVLDALHECGRTAARESGRYTLSKIQVRGRAGQVVGTDGKAALQYGGFTLPFTDDVLVPAVPVFGLNFVTSGDVRIGRTSTHLVLAAGVWAVWLPTDTTGRYPDVAAILPRNPPTTVTIDERDAVALLLVLSGLPGGDDENRPVTLDADRTLTVRGRDDGTREMREVPLPRSIVSGPAVRIALDRRMLARLLLLGCTILKLIPDKPAVAEGDGIVFVAIGLDSTLVVLPAEAPRAGITALVPVPKLPATAHERSQPVPIPETNGHALRGDLADSLSLAEELRAALADAATKAARLVTALRQSKKEKKVLSAVLTNLKQLSLGIGGPQ